MTQGKLNILFYLMANKQPETTFLPKGKPRMKNKNEEFQQKSQKKKDRNGALRRNRTGTPKGNWILNPARLPVPPGGQTPYKPVLSDILSHNSIAIFI